MEVEEQRAEQEGQSKTLLSHCQHVVTRYTATITMPLDEKHTGIFTWQNDLRPTRPCINLQNSVHVVSRWPYDQGRVQSLNYIFLDEESLAYGDYQSLWIGINSGLDMTRRPRLFDGSCLHCPPWRFTMEYSYRITLVPPRHRARLIRAPNGYLLQQSDSLSTGVLFPVDRIGMYRAKGSGTVLYQMTPNAQDCVLCRDGRV